jgi:hypothetical protein
LLSRLREGAIVVETKLVAKNDSDILAESLVNRTSFQVYKGEYVGTTGFLTFFLALFAAFALPLNYFFSFTILFVGISAITVPFAITAAKGRAHREYQRAIFKLASAIAYFEPLIGLDQLTVFLQDLDVVRDLPRHAKAWAALGRRIDPPTFDAVFLVTAAKGNFEFASAVAAATTERSQRGWATRGDIEDVTTDAVQLCLSRDTLTQAGMRTAFRELLYTNVRSSTSTTTSTSDAL